MNRRNFLSIIGAPLLAQSTGKPVNLDHLSNLDGATGMQMSPVAPRLIQNAGPILPVYTRSGSNLRYGAYQESQLSIPTTVASGLRKKFSLLMPGDKRGIEAQPLFAPAVKVNGTAHDVCICTDMANQVWAFDANTGAKLWVTLLGHPVSNTRQIDAWLINDHWGILSTGVIDSGVLYCVAWISADGTAGKAAHSLFAVNLSTGAVIRKLALTTPSAIQRKQRAALTLDSLNGGRKTIFIPWGTIQETSDGAHGDITAVDVESSTVLSEFSITTGAGSGGGIWNAGQGLVSDGNFLYVLTGNGAFDGVSNWGESFLKLAFDGTHLKVADSWTPWTDAARGTQWDDQDLGSGGLLVIPSAGLVLGAGKDGIVYVVHQANMGGTKLADLTNPAANYAKLAQPPSWLTFFPGFGVSAAPTNPESLNTMYFGQTHHQHGSPLYWNGRIFCWGENSNLRAFSLAPNGALGYLGRSAEVASPFAQTPPGGMPGGMMCLAESGNNAVIFACVPDGDANRALTTGRVFAFDPNNMSGELPDGDPQIARIWMSDTYQFNKFNLPVVNGGNLYVPTYSGSVDVFGV